MRRLNVRYWPKADMAHCAAHVAFGGKADTTFAGFRFCGRYWG